MIQDAINALSGLQKQYNNSFSIEVMVDGSINLYVYVKTDEDLTEKHQFKNATDMIDWMDNNLENEQ